MKYRVLVTEPLLPGLLDQLQEHANVEIGERGMYDREDALIEAAPHFDALFTMLSNPVTAKVIHAGKNLKVIANYAVGHNNIDSVAAKKAGIHVTNTPDVLTEATADIAWMLILAAARKLRASETALRNGLFDGWDPTGFVGFDLNGKTLGIVGMGRIGRAVARRGLGFGMKIAYHNRKPLPSDVESSLQAEYVADFAEMARRSDFLSLNCPLTAENHHLVNSDVFKMMKNTAILINTGRGPLVDEAALAQALHDGEIAAAGLDVFEFEPKIHPDLLTAPNTVLLPHIGSATIQTRSQMAEMSINGILHILNGRNPADLKNLVV